MGGGNEGIWVVGFGCEWTVRIDFHGWHTDRERVLWEMKGGEWKFEIFVFES